ncbi:hypothetical protein L3073_15650 [Ancylomarina sp. DW003]|uniref:Uncharacterized protein n=1 Tax=Paralabilibaculum antarcticum TaxID=2912572 RepID=A0ABT5VXM8_9BACT|nr:MULTISPECIES: hypothetical protein [Marinifilaceae]MDE5420175.1 hypothetical protein [Labilibaculum sp. DW002]MDE5423654.1 hypothetical protein [Ancylomarina sp. DW003]
MSNTLSKYLNILTYVMLGLTVVFVAMFYFGGEVPNAAYTTPVHTDSLIYWAKALFYITVGLSILFPIIQLVTNPKGAIKGLAGLAGLGLVILIAYSLSDGTLLNLPGYTGEDNNPSSLKFADTILYTMYILGVGAIASIVVTEALRKLR